MIQNGQSPSEFILRPEVAKVIIDFDKPFVEQMKYKISLVILASLMIFPAFAQEESKNPTLSMVNIDIDYNDFNKTARDQVIIPFDDIHDVSWQVNLVNELLYGNPSGNGVIRFYDCLLYTSPSPRDS